MPIDPATGQQMPYAGEPGAAPGAPPPGADMGPGPGDVMDAEADEAAARQGMLAAAAPKPTKPFAVKAVQNLISQFNDTLDALGGGDLPDVAWEPPPDAGAKWNEPLPPEIFAPLLALSEALKMVEDGKFDKKYGYAPTEIVDDTQVRKVTAQLKRMAKDKGLAEAMQAPVEGPEEAPSPVPPPPGEMSPEDQALMNGMGPAGPEPGGPPA